MMHQVLIIDDEPLVHYDLSTLIDWRKNGFQLCGEAYSGVAALELIEQSSPHIAIIDVNMPDMNGVELHRTIRARYPAVKVIMLSSYDDYDYVRECLNNGAIDYLLKHRLDGAALTAVLDKAAQQLQRENWTHDNAEHENRAESIHPTLIRDLITDVARGNSQASVQLEKLASGSGLYSNAVRYAAAAVQIIPFLLHTESYSDVQTNQLAQQAVEIMQQSLGDIDKRTAAYMGNGRLVVVFSFLERSEHAAASEANRFMSKLQHSLELFLNLKCDFAIGHVCGSLSQLRASYDSAEKALDWTSASDDAARTGVRPERTSLSIEEQRLLHLSLESLDKEGMHQFIASIFESIRHQPVHTQAVQTIVSELLHIGDKALEKWLPALTAKDAADHLPARSGLGKIRSISEFEQWLQSFYTAILGLLMQQRIKGSYSRHVSQAIHMMLERYQKDINLQLAASEIGLNPSYLSRIFKEETQMTFSEYLNRVRIDASRKLLESGQYSIKETSNRAGFATYNYFFKVFKELTGMTPHEYVSSIESLKQSKF